MLNFKKTLIILIEGALIVFVALPILGWIILFIVTLLSPNPPKPEIKYGEFPFKLEYEINGEQKLIEDSVICEFDGIGWDEAHGKFRKWKNYLLSGNENKIVLSSKVDDSSGIHYKICYFTGSADYYMGATYKDETAVISPPRVYETLKGNSIGIEELLEKYSIKLINWEHTSPIVNHFY